MLIQAGVKHRCAGAEDACNEKILGMLAGKHGLIFGQRSIISTHAAAFGYGFCGRSMAGSLGWWRFQHAVFLVDGCGELRGGIEEFLGQREEAQSAFVPLGDALEAELVVGAVLGGQAGQ